MQDSVGFLSAFIAGFISFISPCVLPLVPIYLTTMTGLTAAELEQKEGGVTARIFFASLAFCLGLSVVFIALGLTATGLGTFLTNHIRTFELVAGILIAVFGLHMTGLIKIGFLLRTLQIQTKPQEVQKTQGFATLLKPFSMGLLFAFGWTPCVGPILAGVLALAATKETLVQGGVLLAVYSAGLSIPFILAGLAFGKFSTSYKKFRKHMHVVEIIAGVLLMVFGIMIATHNFARFAGFFSRFLPTPEM